MRTRDLDCEKIVQIQDATCVEQLAAVLQAAAQGGSIVLIMDIFTFIFSFHDEFFLRSTECLHRASTSCEFSDV